MPILAFLLGAAFFAAVFGFECIDPFNTRWLLLNGDAAGATDQASHFMGWAYFAKSPWSFPLGSNPAYFTPLHPTVAYTDSIPWLAVLTKLLAGGAVTAPVQYSGLWLLLSFGLTGLFSSLCARFFTNDRWIQLAVVLFGITSPALTTRLGHISLCGHWLILAAIYHSLSWNLGEQRFIRHIVLGLFLSIIAWTSHPYLGAMVSTIFLAWLLAAAGSWGRCLSAAVSFVVVMLGVFWLFGFFPSLTEKTGGSHYWSADVFTFFNSMGRSALLPGFRTWGGQYEGFAFLGTGGLLLWVVLGVRWLWLRYGAGAAPVIPNAKSASWISPKHPVFPLVCALLLLFVYSLSYHIRFFSKWLISIEWVYAPFEIITSSFRASGRFAWPIYYALLLGVVPLVRHAISRHRAYPLIAFAIALQAWCQWPVWTTEMRPKITFQPERYTELVQEIAQSKHIHVVPPFIIYANCLDENYPRAFWIPLAYYGAQQGVSINSGSIANLRSDLTASHCAQESDILADVSRLRSDTLYVLGPRWHDAHRANVSAVMDCRPVAGYTLCRTGQRPE